MVVTDFAFAQGLEGLFLEPGEVGGGVLVVLGEVATDEAQGQREVADEGGDGG